MGTLQEIRRTHEQAARLEMAIAIREALESHGWRLGAAAAALGEHVRTLQRLIESEGMQPAMVAHGVRRGRPRTRPIAAPGSHVRRGPAAGGRGPGTP
jgi:hypothetical protein